MVFDTLIFNKRDIIKDVIKICMICFYDIIGNNR